MDVVRQIRRVSGIKKVGHGGTLDPIATGVIPVAIGSYTRLLEYVINGDKAYTAEIQLGAITDTFDADGTVIENRDPSNVGIDHIEQVLLEFTGTYNQTPPLYSAKKINGRRLYDYARQQIPVKINSNQVFVKEIKIQKFDQATVTLSLKCSKGFYVRSLANDVGLKLGCGAYLKSLIRTTSGSFTANNSVPLSDALSIINSGGLEDIILALDECLPHIPKIHLADTSIKYIKTGRAVLVSEEDVQLCKDQSIWRAYNDLGEFTAIVKFDSENLEFIPYKVFSN